MQHDHVLKKLDFDFLTPSPGSGGGGGRRGGSAGKIFATVLLTFVILFNLIMLTMF